MSKRKLQAIGYEKDFIDLEDDNVYRNFVCEMETRYLQTKDDAWIQSVLKTEKTEEWNKKLNDYFAESGFISFGTRAAAVDCILNSVVEKMFNENADVQKLTSSEYTRLAKPKVQKEVSPAELTHHINDLCKMLHIVPHPDPMVSLEAACIYINKYLNSDYVKEKVAEEKEGKQVKTFDLRSFPSGLPNYNSGIVNAAARILRLLNIETLRETQTKVNETLVAIQNITADKAN